MPQALNVVLGYGPGDYIWGPMMIRFSICVVCNRPVVQFFCVKWVGVGGRVSVYFHHANGGTAGGKDETRLVLGCQCCRWSLLFGRRHCRNS